MRKFLIIPIAVVFLLSGAHFSLATHTCSGKIAAVKISFSGEKASCGMESEMQETAKGTLLDAECCHDFISISFTDTPVHDTYFGISVPACEHFQFPIINDSFSFLRTGSTVQNHTDTGPPGIFCANGVSLSTICNYRC